MLPDTFRYENSVFSFLEISSKNAWFFLYDSKQHQPAKMGISHSWCGLNPIFVAIRWFCQAFMFLIIGPLILYRLGFGTVFKWLTAYGLFFTKQSPRILVFFNRKKPVFLKAVMAEQPINCVRDKGLSCHCIFASWLSYDMHGWIISRICLASANKLGIWNGSSCWYV